MAAFLLLDYSNGPTSSKDAQQPYVFGDDNKKTAAGHREQLVVLTEATLWCPIDDTKQV